MMASRPGHEVAGDEDPRFERIAVVLTRSTP
jgi:hypothetical protein